MDWFETKKALLEYLGKDPNDRKLVDRMVSRGEVYMEDGMYYLVDKDAIIKELREKIIFLEKESGNNTTNDVKNQLEEAKVQWEYWEKECRRYWRLTNNVISVCYRKLKGLLGSRFTMSEEEFRDGVIEEVKMGEE